MKFIFIYLCFLINFVFAADNTCGDFCSWSLDQTVLTITGNGTMDNYKSGSQPWYSERENI